MYKWDSSKRKQVARMRDLTKEIIDQLDKANDTMYCGFLDVTEYPNFQGNLNIAHDKAVELLKILYDEIRIGESEEE